MAQHVKWLRGSESILLDRIHRVRLSHKRVFPVGPFIARGEPFSRPFDAYVRTELSWKPPA